MASVIAFITKTFLTEAMIRRVVIVLGDYLVGSTKNKLDDKLWAQIKRTLSK